jgi:hypothetical protein
MKKLSNSSERIKNLKAEKKIEFLNKKEDLESTKRLNDFFNDVKSDYNLKEKQSKVSAFKVVLTS